MESPERALASSDLFAERERNPVRAPRVCFALNCPVSEEMKHDSLEIEQWTAYSIA